MFHDKSVVSRHPRVKEEIHTSEKYIQQIGQSLIYTAGINLNKRYMTD
jgi:hypothetical protein